MRLYDLVKLTIEGDKVISREVLKTDLPFIVVGHLNIQIRNQGFTDV